MDESELLERARNVIILVLSLTVHEWAHAMSAYRLGDDTAKSQGRLTLDPTSHIDPIGTLLLPLLGIPFGWARPVPFNPARFGRRFTMSTSTMLVAVAGPLSNLVLAGCCLLFLGLMLRFSIDNDAVAVLLHTGFGMNVLLAFFNMLPIPPLDGSRLAEWLLPRPMRPHWARVVQYGPLLLLAVIFMPYVVGVSLFSWPLGLLHHTLVIPFLSAMAGA